MNDREMLRHMLSTEVLTSFDTAKLLASHVTAIGHSKDIVYSTDLSNIYTIHFCSIIDQLAELDGHICRIKEQNYLSKKVGIDLIKDSIPYFVDMYISYLDGTEYKSNIGELIAEYSKEEIFCIRIILDQLSRLLKSDRIDLQVISEGMKNFKKVPLLTELFSEVSISELKAMSTEDFEDFLETEKECDDNTIVKLSTLRDILDGMEVAQTAIFINQEPITEVYSLSIPDRIDAARVQLLLQDLSKMDDLLGTVV